MSEVYPITLPLTVNSHSLKLHCMHSLKNFYLLQIYHFVAFNPTKRLTVEEALSQPYLEEYYDPLDEPVAQKPFQYEVSINVYLIFNFEEIIKNQTEIDYLFVF